MKKCKIDDNTQCCGASCDSYEVCFDVKRQSASPVASVEFDSFFDCVEKNACRVDKDAMIGRIVRERLGDLNSIVVIRRFDVERYL